MSAVRENRRPYGFKKLLEAVTDVVPVERLVMDAGAQLRPQGNPNELRGYGVCHGGDNSTALVVHPERGTWRCFRCDTGGDVLDLYMALHGYEEKKHALIDLAGEYGVQTPGRPQGWHVWQDEKARRRRMFRNTLAESYRRRFFRVFGSYLADIEDNDSRREEARRFWADLWPLAISCAEWRLSR